MKKFKKVISTVIVGCMLLSIGVSAADNETDSHSSEESEYNNNVITITNAQDIASMNERDEKEYDEKLSNIDSKLRNDYNQFVKNSKGIQSLNGLESNSSKGLDANNTELIENFLKQYPEYKSIEKSTLTSEIRTLNFNATVEIVRAFFKNNGYDLSLALFNHSLTDNPEKAYMNLNGNTAGMYGHVKNLLKNDGFFNKMVAFSKAGHDKQTLSDSTYAFANGDLYLGDSWIYLETNKNTV